MTDNNDPQNAAPLGQDAPLSNNPDWLASGQAPKNDHRMMWVAFVIVPVVATLLAIAAFTLISKLNPKGPLNNATSQIASSDKDAQIAQLMAQNALLQSKLPTTPSLNPAQALLPQSTNALPTPSTSTSQSPNAYSDLASLNRLLTRVERLEDSQRNLADATALAMAATRLEQASHTSAPFLSELAAVEASINDPNLIATLRPLAQKGVPSVVELAVSFPQALAASNTAAKNDDGKTDLIAKLRHALSSIISVRHVNNDAGLGAEAILHRAETRMIKGDLEGTVAYLNSLPKSSLTALKPWLDQAKNRLLIDQLSHNITQVALNRLALSANKPLSASDAAQTQAPLPNDQRSAF